MTRFLSIIGTRPQYIKVLDNLPSHVIVDTRQHYDEDMSDVFIKQLKIKPKYSLGKSEFGPMYEACLEVIKKEDPEVVIVYGDTRSTLAGALAAKFAGKELAHVEAGMRSYDIKQPEEIIRIIVDRVSDFRFCANEFAREALMHESLTLGVAVVGDPMWDALNKVLPIPKSKDYEKYNLLTIHRPANTDNETALSNIIEALNVSGERFIFPCHPRTRRALKKFGIKLSKNIEMVKPQGYKEMIKLETNAKKILTDSGGVTREAYWFQKPLIILRTETEWREVVKDKWGVLVGSQKDLILGALKDHNPHPIHTPQNYMPKFGAKEGMKQILLG